MRVMDHTNYQDYQDRYGRDIRAAQGTDNQSTLDEDSQENGVGTKAEKQESNAGAKTAKQENSTGAKAAKQENGAGAKVAGRDAETMSASRSNTYSYQSGESNDLIERLRQEAEAIRKSFARSRNSTLYSSTGDLMAIANTESQEILRGIYVRLSFKMRSLGISGASSSSIKSASRSIKKVMGKVKGKIRSLQKEEEMEKRVEAARKAKQRRLQQEIRRQLAIKRKIRKNRERKDVADSYFESDGQYSEKSYLERLPENVQAEMEMQSAGSSGAAAVDAGVPIEVAIAAAGVDAPMGVDTAVAVAEVSGAVVDVAL